MTYKQINDYFKNLANKSKLIAHNRPVFVASDELRVSFVSVEHEDGVNTIVDTGIHFPCVVILDLSGNLVYKNGALAKKWSNTLWFLHKHSANNEQEVREECYGKAELAMNQVLSAMANDLEEQGSCGPFKHIDFSNIYFSMTGMVSDGIFGWKLSISSETSANDISTYDPTKWY